MKNIISFKRFINDKEYRTIVLTSVSGIFLLISWFGWLNGVLPFDAAWVSIIISSTPILKAAFIGLIKRFDIKAGVLVSMALIASAAIGEYFAAGEVAFIMMIGEILEHRTVRKAQEGIKKLVRMAPATARIRTAEGEIEIPVEQVGIGDILLVKPGELIPVDGVITNGRSSVDQSVITGESMPVDKQHGDEVFVGTVNHFGAIEVKALKVGEDTSLSKLIKLVRESEKKKAPIVRAADKWASIMVPAALAISVVTYLVTWDISRAVTILVVFCPCALVLATPTAIIAGIGNASRKGILIKSGEALELAGKIDTVAFDKTGTITNGKPEVRDVISLSSGYSDQYILELAASAEKFSEHPVGNAIYLKAKDTIQTINDPESFEMELGRGVIAEISGKRILAGNLKLMKAENIEIKEEIKKMISSYECQGKTVVIIASEGEAAGLITVADGVKAKAAEAVKKLREIRIKNILLITGDNTNTALSIAGQVGIESVFSEQLPAGKVKVIEDRINENSKVCMVGDGINDAPALARADIGVAMGALGADVAVETADIALMSDDIVKVPELLSLSKKVFRTITANFIIAMGINLIAIVLAAVGVINPVIGALVHNLGSVLVVWNSAALIRYGGYPDKALPQNANNSHDEINCDLKCNC